MTTYKQAVICAVSIFSFAFSINCSALQPTDVKKLAPQSEISLPLPINGVYDIRSVKLDSIGVFKDADGSEWLRLVTAGDSEIESQTLFVDAAGSTVEIGLNMASLDLKNLSITIEQLRGMAKTGNGSLSYEGRTFSFSGAGRSKYFADGKTNPANVGYFVLQQDQDPNYSIMVLNWGDKVEVLLNEKLDPQQISTK